MELRALDEQLAREVCSWHYEGLYSVYNLADWDVVVQNSWSLADERIRSENFFSIWHEEKMIGFGRIEKQADLLVQLGIGLSPDCCGKGYGTLAMKCIIKEAQTRHPVDEIGLEVRRFNKRAIKCYESVGFVTDSIYMKETLHGFIAYQSMRLVVES